MTCGESRQLQSAFDSAQASKPSWDDPATIPTPLSSTTSSEFFPHGGCAHARTGGVHPAPLGREGRSKLVPTDTAPRFPLRKFRCPAITPTNAPSCPVGLNWKGHLKLFCPPRAATSELGQNAKYVFRFAPDNRHSVTAPPRPFRANTGSRGCAPSSMQGGRGRNHPCSSGAASPFLPGIQDPFDEVQDQIAPSRLPRGLDP
jgi:hypothetical protein